MIWLAVATGCTQLDCGKGTVEREGVCVSSFSCGPGTERVDGACVALDSVPDAGIVCGPGTLLVDDTCVAQEDLACGEGTIQRGDSCVPLTTQYVRLPYDPGVALTVSQGHHGGLSHSGDAVYAVDFVAPEGTPIRAMREGRVLVARDDSDSGCGTIECADQANLVIIDHGDATLGFYYHLELDGALVAPGDRVGAGAVIGLSGNTGFSTGPHIHVQIEDLYHHSLPLRFEELLDESGGVVAFGMQIPSENEELPASDVDYSECPADAFAFLGVFLDPGVPCTSAERGLTYPVSGWTTAGTQLIIGQMGAEDWVYSCLDTPDADFSHQLSWDGPAFGGVSFLVFSVASGGDCRNRQGWDASPQIWLR